LNFYKDNDDEQKFLHSAHVDANKYMIGVLDRSKTAHRTDRGNYWGPFIALNCTKANNDISVIKIMRIIC